MFNISNYFSDFKLFLKENIISQKNIIQSIESETDRIMMQNCFLFLFQTVIQIIAIIIATFIIINHIDNMKVNFASYEPVYNLKANGVINADGNIHSPPKTNLICSDDENLVKDKNGNLSCVVAPQLFISNH